MDQALSVVNRDLEKEELQLETTKVIKPFTRTKAKKPRKKIKKKRNRIKGEIDFSRFTYPLNIDMEELVQSNQRGVKIHEKPINKYTHSFIFPHRKHCETQNQNSLFLILVIKSTNINFDKRMAIRETWGNARNLQKRNVRIIFIVGMSNNTKIQANIKRENLKFNDIIQMDFIDSYQNNTLKTIGSIKWMARFCYTSKFVFMLDDDFFVAIGNVIDFLKKIPKSKEKNLFTGVLWDDEPPQRLKKQKWHISVKKYPYEKYPMFLSGGAMLMSMDFVQRLYIAIPYTKLFKFDDVYLGIVAHKLKVKPQRNKNIHVFKVPYNTTAFKNVLASHGFNNTNEMRKAWEIHSLLQKVKEK